MFTHLINRLAPNVFVTAVICTLFAGAPPIAAQPCEETTWTDFDEQPGYGFVMAYDSARGVLVAFDESTWESAGDGPWIKRTSAGPTMRQWVPMVYDAARGVCLLFGGSQRSDTWTWDGEAWTLVSNTGPVGRRAHAMTYDPDNNRVLLFGGMDANFAPLGDTWAWDGTSWHLLTSSGPTPRSGMSLAYDTARHRAVLYGGFSSTMESDTWEFDGTSWSRISFIGPTRSAQSMVYDTARGVTVLHGGSGSADFGDTWEWDGAVWTQVDSVGPAGSRLRAQMVFHTALDRVVMASGDYAAVSHIVVWAWDGTRWSPLWTPAPSPPPGRGPMVYDSLRERCVANISSDIGHQTWEWDGHGWELKAAGNVPVGPMVFDTFRGVSMLLSEVGETWTWNGEQWTNWTGVTGVGPGARIGAAMAFDSDRGVAVFFGGQGRTDTWEWNGETWAMAAASAPTPIARTGAAMCYDSIMHRTIMFGGYIIGNINELSDTWSWDGKRDL